jgi:putative PIN family toxin of toxin-antitoxin system
MPDRYFVIDTNIVISIAVFSSLTPALSLKKVLYSGSLAFSEPVLQEYAETLSNHKFDKYLPLEKRLLFLEKLIAEGDIIPITKRIKICRDPKDDKYLELAAASNASCIITGNKDLLILHPFQNISILSPVDFINQY